MKIISNSILYMLLFVSTLHSEVIQQAIPVNRNGLILIDIIYDNTPIRISIDTQVINVKNKNEQNEPCKNFNCSDSKNPYNMVNKIKLRIDNKAIFFPRSAFCDLTDIISASLIIENEEMILLIIGGDASESYKVEIIFDKKRVKRRVFYSLMLPDKPLQQTTYYSRVIE